ncbi:hypothetical protein EXIGLDRAFT_613837 [Exidia glandulosa HHB12029]|uniref:DNA-directed DNA polymerase n=1 Tax=Exidia glandulosa HHB12029 TaxID=1314781 RepID=A0A165I3E8_EXIGL|nr:hypothetical protein EXIGLDRAFT_613837 [Exidia glandulosa HHB12029]
MSTTLEYFWHLSAAGKKERLDASAQLVSALETFQSQFEPSSSKTGADELERQNAPDVAYAIKRLVRGLASPRESARLGFSVALTEARHIPALILSARVLTGFAFQLLARLDTVTANQMITLILEASETSNAMKGHEERDMLFARLFGLTALAQSGLLVRASDAATEDDFARVIDALDNLGQRKSWLAESAAWAVSRALDTLAKSDVAWRDSAAKRAVKKSFADETGAKEWTQENVALALHAQKGFPDLKWKKLLSPTFKDANILSTGHLATLAKIFKDGSVDQDSEAKQNSAGAGGWKPQIHFVWDVILDTFYPPPSSSSSSDAALASIQDFFRIVVDETYFANSASSERKYHGFLIFQKFASRIPPSELPLLLTKNFMRTWINHLSHPDRYLHKIAKQVALDVQKLVSKDPRSGFALVLELLGRNGNRQFDQITRTKTVESILASMSASGIREYVDYLLGQINESEASGESDATAKRTWILDQLSALIRNGAVPKDDDCVKTVLDFFVLHGFFVVKKKEKAAKGGIAALRHVPEPPFTVELQKECRARLLAAIAELLTFTPSKKEKGAEAARQPGYAHDGELWLTKVWNTISELEKDTKHVAVVRAFSEEETTLRVRVSEVLALLPKVRDKEETGRGVHLLLAGGLLQELTDEDKKSTEDFQDCIDAAKRMLATTKPKSKGKKKQTEDDEEEPEPIDVLVNLLIGYLERGTAYTRAVATRAFEPLCPALQTSSIKLIMSQLERRPVGEVVEGEDDDDVEMEDGDDVEATASDSEEEEDEEEDDDEEASDSDDPGVEDDEDDDDEVPDAELRSRIEEALRLSGIQAAGEDDSDEELMDDDQMMQLDAHLADVFRLRKSEKGGAKQNTNAQREATHFKNRVLDFVDIYIRKQPTSPHLPSIVLPLLDLVTGTGQDEKQLQEKASGILRSRLGKNKELPSLSDAAEAEETFKELHVRARKARSGQALAVISQCAVYIARMLESSSAPAVAEEYGKSLADYAKRKTSPLNTSFFLDFARRLPKVAWRMHGPLLVAMEDPVNFYRGTQLFLVFQALASPIPTDQPEEVLASAWRDFRKVLYRTISRACEADPAPKPAQLKDVLKVGHAAMRQSKRGDTPQEKFEKLWDASQLAQLVEQVADSPRFKSATAVQTLMRQMNSLANPSASPERPKVNGASKRKVDEQEGDAKPHRKKVKKSKD